MSMEHKAYVLDYDGFGIELVPILWDALLSGDSGELLDFIQQNFSKLKDPYEGDLLTPTWQDMIETKDVHQYGDFALTKYYDPRKDIGLNYDWRALEELLNSAEDYRGSSLVLGEPLGPSNNYFDPGKMGSFFQVPLQASENLLWLEHYLKQHPGQAEMLKKLTEMLESATKAEQGLYITF